MKMFKLPDVLTKDVRASVRVSAPSKGRRLVVIHFLRHGGMPKSTLGLAGDFSSQPKLRQNPTITYIGEHENARKVVADLLAYANTTNYVDEEFLQHSSGSEVYR